jgi:IclR family acetate operon transcriptional repressor
MSEIADATGLYKGSIQRVLVTLQHHRAIERDESTKKYSLGLALAEYGRAALNRLDIRATAKPLLQELVEYSGETAVLAVLQGTKIVTVDKKEPLTTIRVSPFVGMTFPVTATADGKALLAWLPESRVEELIRAEGLPARTPKSLTDPSAYRAELAATRARGYAIDREEFRDGVSAVAAPVFDAARQAVAVIATVGPAFRMSEEKLQDYGRKCIELSARISGGH